MPSKIVLSARRRRKSRKKRARKHASSPSIATDGDSSTAPSGDGILTQRQRMKRIAASCSVTAGQQTTQQKGQQKQPVTGTHSDIEYSASDSTANSNAESISPPPSLTAVNSVDPVRSTSLSLLDSFRLTALWTAFPETQTTFGSVSNIKRADRDYGRRQMQHTQSAL